MNILKTLKRLLASTKRSSEKKTFLKCREISIDNYKSERKPLKILVEKHSFGKITGPHLSTLSKNELYYRRFSSYLPTF